MRFLRWASSNVGMIVLVLAALIVLGVTVPVKADQNSGDRITQSNDMNNQTAGDIVTGSASMSSKAFAFSHGLGDVDLNEGKNCLGSEAWGTFIISRQTNELNPWCASLFYELNGRHEFAAKMRCDIKSIGNKYTSKEECWIDQNLSPSAAAPDVAEVIVSQFTSGQEIQNEELETVQMAQHDMYARLTALEQKPAPRTRTVQAAPEPALTEEMKEAAWIALKGGDEDE